MDKKDYQAYLIKMDLMNNCIDNKCKKPKKKLNDYRMKMIKERDNIRKDEIAKKISKKEASNLIKENKKKLHNSTEKRNLVKCQLDKCYQEAYNLEITHPEHHKKHNPQYINKVVKNYIDKFRKSRITVDDLIKYEMELNRIKAKAKK